MLTITEEIKRTPFNARINSPNLKMHHVSQIVFRHYDRLGHIFNKALELNTAYQQNREWSWSGLITECFELGGAITVASLHYTHTYFAQSLFNSVE